jgi:glycine cleavage system H protein
MSGKPGKYLHYKRSHFATQLPLAYWYSPTHYWIARLAESRLRIGLTKFATRMLGEMVDHGFEIRSGQPVAPGQILGWVEGFKAISDVYCVATGTFAGLNPALKERITLINQDPYADGWLYEVDGQPDARCLDARAYRDHLDVTISRLLEKRGQNEQNG